MNMSSPLPEFSIDDNEPVYTTGVVCRLIGIPIWVLKQLDSAQIVSPPRRRQGVSRLYSPRQLRIIKHCWYYLHEHRVKINGLRIILELEGIQE